MKFSVAVQPSAQAEIEAAYAWIAERAPLTAIQWYNRLLKAVGSLADHPERCSLAPEDEFFPEEIRNLFYGKRRHACRIIFTIRGDTVRVLHFRRGSQQVFKPDDEKASE
jgi:plasmid stabilization system protein ParE